MEVHEGSTPDREILILLAEAQAHAASEAAPKVILRKAEILGLGKHAMMHPAPALLTAGWKKPSIIV